MKRNRVYFGIMILALVIVIVWASYSMLNVGKSEETYSVSVIVNDSNNDRWIALRQGLQQAAGDCNIDLNYVSTGEIQSVEEQMALVNRELDNGAEGIIVQMISSEEGCQPLEEITSRAAVVLLESDAEPEDLFTLTSPDNYEMGMALVEAIKQDLGTGVSGKTVGIVCGNQSQLAMEQRLAGVQEGLAEAQVNVLWIVEEIAEQGSGTEIMSGMETPDIIIALENEGTERVVDQLMVGADDGKNCLLYGVGCSEKAVYYLDKGIIQTLVVPNEFNMGYLSMETIAEQLQYHLSEAKDSQVDYLVINRDNLYDEDNQKILFPIVQ